MSTQPNLYTSLRLFSFFSLPQNSHSFVFPELNEDDARARLWKSIIRHLSSKVSDAIAKDLLVSLRILSRERKDLNEIVCPEFIDVLLKCAGIVSEEEAVKLINEDENFEGMYMYFYVISVMLLDVIIISFAPVI